MIVNKRRYSIRITEIVMKICVIGKVTEHFIVKSGFVRIEVKERMQA